MARVGQQDGKTINFSMVFGPQHRPFKCVYWTDPTVSCRPYKNKPNANNMYTVWQKSCLFVYAFTSASLLGGIFCQIFLPNQSSILRVFIRCNFFPQFLTFLPRDETKICAFVFLQTISRKFIFAFCENSLDKEAIIQKILHKYLQNQMFLKTIIREFL